MKKVFLFLVGLSSTLVISQKEIQCGDALSVSKGNLIDTSSITPRMTLLAESKAKVGSTGELALLTEDESFRMTFSIGRVIVTAVDGNVMTFEVVEKLGVITINGVVKSNFKEGALVQFTEYEYDSPKLIELKYESGAIKESGYMLCGNKMGEWTEFHENGAEKCTYRTDKNGDIEGRYTEYYSNGKIASDGEYRYGKKTGMWTEYFEDGTIKSQGYYYDGQKTGKWIEHDATGKKRKVKY